MVRCRQLRKTVPLHRWRAFLERPASRTQQSESESDWRREVQATEVLIFQGVVQAAKKNRIKNFGVGCGAIVGRYNSDTLLTVALNAVVAGEEVAKKTRRKTGTKKSFSESSIRR